MKAKGIVAFFDVLGYKTFLIDGACDDAAELVVKTIAGSEESVVSYLRATAEGEDDAQDFIRHVNSITWVVFADTMLLLCPFEGGITSRDAARRWYVVILSAQILSKHMFEVGLPLRGCISYGDFIHENNCFAGKVILEAHDCANSLELAASVIDSTAHKELLAAFEPFALRQDLHAKIMLVGNILDYCVPTKSGLRDLHILNFVAAKGISKVPSAWIGECQDIVLRSFSQHNKTLNKDAHTKAINTVSFLSFLERKFPGILQDEGRNQET